MGCFFQISQKQTCDCQPACGSVVAFFTPLARWLILLRWKKTLPPPHECRAEDLMTSLEVQQRIKGSATSSSRSYNMFTSSELLKLTLSVAVILLFYSLLLILTIYLFIYYALFCLLFNRIKFSFFSVNLPLL